MKSKKNVILFLLVILSLLFIFVSCSPEEEPEEPVKVVKTHANLRSYKGSFIYKDGKYDTSLIQGDDIKINEYGKVSGTLYKREWSGEAWEDGKKSGYYLALEVYGLENNASYSFSLGLNDRVNAKYRDSYNSFYTYNGTSSSNQYLIYIDENKKGSIVSFKFGNSPERNLDFSSVTFVDNDSYDINSKKLSAIKSEEELKTALNNGGDYFLSSDVAVSSDLTFAKTIDIDLDGKKITSSGSFIISSSPDATDTTIKLSNGNISFSKASANDYAISVGSNTSFTLESVNVESNCNGITIPSSSSGSVTLNSSKVDLFDGNYGIYMDGEGGSVSVDGSDITLHDSGEKDDSGIVVTNGNFGNTTAIFFGQSGNLTINNTTLSSSRQAVVMTAGSGKVENSTLKVSGNNTNDQYLTTDWGSGNEVPLAVLVVGNRVTDAKDITLELTNVTLKKTRLINKSTYEYSTIYVYQNDNTDVRVSGNLSSDSSKLVNTDDNSGHYPAYSVGGGKDDTLFSPTINIKTYDNANNTATIEIIPSKNNPSDVSYKAYVSYDVVDEDDSGDTILDNDGNATIKERIEREDVSASISGTTITLSKQKKIQDLVVVASKDGYSDSPDSVKLQIGGTEKNKLSTPEFTFEKSNEDSDKINAKFRSTYDREFSVVDENGNSITATDDSDGTFSFEVNKDLTEHTYTIIAEPTDVNLYDNSAPQTLTQSVKKLTTPTVSNLLYGEENGTKYATVDITTADSVSDIKFSLSATSNLVENTTSTYRIDLTQDIQELTVYAYVEGDEYERSLKTTSIKIKPISPISLDTPSIKEEISSNTSSYVFSINEVKNASSYEVKLGNAPISELNGKYSVNYKTTPQSVVITAKGDGEFYQDSIFNLTVKGKLATPSFTASYANNDTFILTAVPVDNAGGYLVKVGNKTLTPGSDGKYTEKLKSEMQTITVVAQPSDSTNYIDSEAQSLSIKGKIAVPTIGNIKEDRSQGIVYFEVSNVSNLGTLKVELHDDSTSSVITPATSGDYTGKYVVNIDTTKAQSIRAMVEVKSENSSAYFSSNYVTSKILQGIEEPQITTLTLDNEVYFKIDNKEEGVSYSVIAVNADDENDKTSLSEMAEGDYVGYYRLLYKPNRQEVSFVGRKTSSRYDSKTVTQTIPGKLSSPKFVPSFDDTNTQMLLATVAVPNATSYEVIVEGTTHISPDTDGIYSITLGNTEQIVTVVAKGDGTNYIDSNAQTLTVPSNTAATLINISKTDEGDRVVFIVNKIDSNATVSFSINNNETLPDQNSENTYTVHRSNIKKDIVITSTSDVDPTVTETQTFTVTGVFDIPEFTSDERSDGASITITPVKVDNAVYSVTVDGTIASEDSDGNYVIPRTASPQNVEIRALPDSNNKGNYVSSQIQKIFIRGNKLDTPQFTHSREGNSIFITKVDVSNATGYNVKVNDSTITAEREGVNAGKYKVMLSTSEQRVKVKALGGKNYISSDDQEITIKAILATPAFTYTLSDDGNTAIIEKVDVENADTYTLTLNGVTLNAETSGDYIGKYLVALTSSEQTVIITASDSSNRYYSSTEELKIKAK